MNKNTFFSVIVASYNYESYIQETLLSLANQTYKNFEVIVVDDGSKDNSIKIIQDICAQYPNFKLYTHPHNQNKGLKDTILLGLAKAKGDFIAFCESDDYWSEDHLKEVNSAINKYIVSIVLYLLFYIYTCPNTPDRAHRANFILL